MRNMDETCRVGSIRSRPFPHVWKMEVCLMLCLFVSAI